MKISKDTVVSLEYTLKNGEGQIIDSSKGQQPLVYLHGWNNLIPGLERQLEGHEKGAVLSVTVKPEEGFGVRNEEFFHQVSKAGFIGGDEEMQVGMQVQLDTDQGPRIGTISSIEGDTVTLDMNHPLADVTLFFDVEVLELRAASEEELAHGHVHGPGGHHH